MRYAESTEEFEARMKDGPADRVVALILGVVMIGLLAFVAIQGGKALVAFASYAEARRATAECLEWQDQARVYPAYYLTPWQKLQCDTYGVEIDAPVIDYKKQ